MPLATKNYFKMGILSQKKKNSVLTKSQPVKLFFLEGGGGMGWHWAGFTTQKSFAFKKNKKTTFFYRSMPRTPLFHNFN